MHETIPLLVQVYWGEMTMRARSTTHTDWVDGIEDSFSDEDISAIHIFLARPWFELLWIWQEARLADLQSICMCGEEIIT